MSPIAMLSIIVAALAAFAWSAGRRWQLLQVGATAVEGNRFDELGARIGKVLRYGVKQEKMYKYPGAGLAHHLIFIGFVVLLLRSMILWGRGFDPAFGFWVLNPGQPLGDFYGLVKDIVAVLVICGALFFVYTRVVVKPERMTLSREALVILGIILTMMIADIFYDGASIVLHQKYDTFNLTGDLRVAVDKVVAPRMVAEGHARTGILHFTPFEPAGFFAALILQKMSASTLVVVAHAGFWIHSSLVLIFLNILPHSKHFHIITGLPNIFFADLTPRGRLKPLGGFEPLMEKIGDASDTDKNPEPVAVPGLGVGRIEQMSWKAILDFYTCTECGRCSDNCPAHQTGKLLSPKHLTLDLRNYLYQHEDALVARKLVADAPKPDAAEKKLEAEDAATIEAATTGHTAFKERDLVVPSDPAMGIIHPDVIWACTTCRACEEQCPVLISYVDKITDMRRNVVMVRGEFPHELQRTFSALETNGNPWNLSKLDRAAWSDGLDIKMIADKPDAAVLYWVGCAASYDDRAKKIARATAKLLQAAGVDFAILGQEETCTGDPARRAGNEYLFAMLAEQNAATFKQHEVEKKKVITSCPHCFNTLLNEYPDFGAKLDVVHHTTFLMGLLTEKKLTPVKPLNETLVYHDSCYLGRYNDVYDAPREILGAIGAKLVEATTSRSKGLCCGAGGSQMWMEEKGTERVNKKRTLQLLDTGAKTVASACPFCMTMLTDGLKSMNKDEEIRQMDVAELLAAACITEAPVAEAAE